MPSCKKSLPESVLTKISDAILRDIGHNEFRANADFRIVLGSLTGLLVDRIRWVTAKFLDLVSLASPPSFFKQIFSLSCPENSISYLIHYIYKLTCTGENFADKAPKFKLYSSGVTGRPLILHTPHTSSYVFLACTKPLVYDQP